MPVNYKLYPKEWKTEIVPSILKRAAHKCEKCGVANHRVGFWIYGTFINCIVPRRLTNGEYGPNYKQACLYRDELKAKSLDKKIKYIVIVLTVAHLDHDVKNNDPANLAALCQKCHNNYDATMRASRRKYGREVLNHPKFL